MNRTRALALILGMALALPAAAQAGLKKDGRADGGSLSYGEYVGRLVTGTPLPAPIAQRDADRAALRRSCDQLAALAGDINALIRLLRLAQGAVAARQFGDRMRGLEADVRQHIDLASRLVAHPKDPP